MILEALIIVGGIIFFQNRKKKKAEREAALNGQIDPNYPQAGVQEPPRYKDEPSVSVNPMSASLPPHERSTGEVPPPSYGSLNYAPGAPQPQQSDKKNGVFHPH